MRATASSVGWNLNNTLIEYYRCANFAAWGKRLKRGLLQVSTSWSRPDGWSYSLSSELLLPASIFLNSSVRSCPFVNAFTSAGRIARAFLSIEAKAVSVKLL